MGPLDRPTIQTNEVRELLEDFEDDQLQLSLELEAYKQERAQLAKQHMVENQLEQINICYEEQLPVGPEPILMKEEQLKKRVEQPVELQLLQQWNKEEELPRATEEE